MKSILPCRPIEPRAPRNAGAAPDVEQETATRVVEAFDRGWGVTVWNDPVNTMTYVTFVFEKVLKMDRKTAERHMLEVHHKGRSLVATETRERAEFLVHQLQSFGLKATLERV